MTAVVGVVVLGGVGAQAAPLPEPAEVTGAWVCESQGHRATDFRVFDDSAARFAIPAFTTSLGEFRRVDVTLGLDLTTSMAMTLEMAQAETQVRIDALHEIWMNIPPADVTPNFAPVGTARDDNLVVELPIAWADGIYDAGFTDFGTRTWSESVGFSSTDATVWAASGPQVVVMQTLTGLDVFGIAGNGTYTQLTTAAAEVCHRYTYLTLADEVEQVPPPAPEPPEQPTQPEQPTAQQPSPGTPDSELVKLPDTGVPVSLSIALLGALLVTGGAALLTIRRSDGWVVGARCIPESKDVRATLL